MYSERGEITRQTMGGWMEKCEQFALLSVYSSLFIFRYTIIALQWFEKSKLGMRKKREDETYNSSTHARSRLNLGHNGVFPASGCHPKKRKKNIYPMCAHCTSIFCRRFEEMRGPPHEVCKHCEPSIRFELRFRAHPAKRVHSNLWFWIEESNRNGIT